MNNPNLNLKLLYINLLIWGILLIIQLGLFITAIAGANTLFLPVAKDHLYTYMVPVLAFFVAVFGNAPYSLLLKYARRKTSDIIKIQFYSAAL